MWAKEISEVAHVGATTHQGTPGGAGAPWCLVGTRCTPSGIICTRNSEIFRKNHIKFSNHSENFYFLVIFLHEENRKQDNYGILFYLTN